jgi:hypothetical protein
MGVNDQKQFTDAVAARRTGWITEDWKPAIHALNRLAMFDMLPALAAISQLERDDVERLAPGIIGINATKRIYFANIVVRMREIPDWSGSVPDEQINDAREFLGCTRLDDRGVQFEIDLALDEAKKKGPGGRSGEPCCGALKEAWLEQLVKKRRRFPGASLNANLAAAAHYILARYHVCSAKAKPWQMKVVIDGYDEKKRAAIANGDRDLKSMALTAGNRPFPPDFAIRNWAQKGADAGEADRKRCNADAPLPTIFPDVNGSEA